MSDNTNFTELLAEIDWGFRNLSNEGVHSFHWYPATFISAIPGTLIPILSNKGDVVLDPFCGTATSGVESIRLGRRFVGIDTNPIAIMIAFAKLFLPKRASLVQSIEVDQLTFLYHRWNPNGFSHPREEILLNWYEQETYLELAFLIDHISRIENSKMRRCAQAVFSSILKNVSSQSRHWGWVCDNVTPKKGEFKYKSAIEAFTTATLGYLRSSDLLIDDLTRRNNDTSRVEVRKLKKLVCGDCVESMKELDESSIDLIISSPPYYGVADYVKSQRLSMLWFDYEPLNVYGYGFSDFEELRKKEAGSRSHRHRKNSFEQYTRYLARFFEEASRVLKKEAYVALVLGESNARTPTIKSLIDAANELSLPVVYKTTRDIRETRRRLIAKVRGEEIVVFQRT